MSATDQFRMLANGKLAKRVHINFERKIETDITPDLSYLQQDYTDIEDLSERQEALNGQRERFKEFERGDVWMVGVFVVAHILVPIGPGNFAQFDIQSPGVWGVESDSGEEYFAELEQEQKAELIRAMKTMGKAFAKLEA